MCASWSFAQRSLGGSVSTARLGAWADCGAGGPRDGVPESWSRLHSELLPTFGAPLEPQGSVSAGAALWCSQDQCFSSDQRDKLPRP